MSVGIGNAAGGAGDPRMSITGDEKYDYDRAGGETGTAPTRKGRSLAIRDPSVKFEE
jgi:hypothetical protein